MFPIYSQRFPYLTEQKQQELAQAIGGASAVGDVGLNPKHLLHYLQQAENQPDKSGHTASHAHTCELE